MAYGDAIMATAKARGLHAQGKLAAFSVDGKTIKWTGYCEDVFKNNPNIARPGAEKQSNIIWFPHYKKHFTCMHYDGIKRKYIWNYDFRVEPGEIFHDPLGPPPADRFVVIEPNVAWQRAANINKDWGDGKYEKLARALIDAGYLVVQFVHGNSRRKIPGAHRISTTTFHQALGIMSQASLIIAPEGANHHAAAAVNVPAIIVWGGFSPPQTMGYANHIMLTGGATEACGSTAPCPHCRRAFDNISVEEVYQAAIKVMQ